MRQPAASSQNPDALSAYLSNLATSATRAGVNSDAFEMLTRLALRQAGSQYGPEIGGALTKPVVDLVRGAVDPQTTHRAIARLGVPVGAALGATGGAALGTLGGALYGNTPEGLGRGLVAGTAGGAGAAGGAALGHFLATRMINENSPMFAASRLAGTGLGAAVGGLGSAGLASYLMGEPVGDGGYRAHDKEAARRPILTDASTHEAIDHANELNLALLREVPEFQQRVRRARQRRANPKKEPIMKEAAPRPTLYGTMLADRLLAEKRAAEYGHYDVNAAPGYRAWQRTREPAPTAFGYVRAKHLMAQYGLEGAIKYAAARSPTILEHGWQAGIKLLEKRAFGGRYQAYLTKYGRAEGKRRFLADLDEVFEKQAIGLGWLKGLMGAAKHPFGRTLTLPGAAGVNKVAPVAMPKTLTATDRAGRPITNAMPRQAPPSVIQGAGETLDAAIDRTVRGRNVVPGRLGGVTSRNIGPSINQQAAIRPAPGPDLSFPRHAVPPQTLSQRVAPSAPGAAAPGAAAPGAAAPGAAAPGASGAAPGAGAAAPGAAAPGATGPGGWPSGMTGGAPPAPAAKPGMLSSASRWVEKNQALLNLGAFAGIPIALTAPSLVLSQFQPNFATPLQPATSWGGYGPTTPSPIMDLPPDVAAQHITIAKQQAMTSVPDVAYRQQQLDAIDEQAAEYGKKHNRVYDAASGEFLPAPLAVDKLPRPEGMDPTQTAQYDKLVTDAGADTAAKYEQFKSQRAANPQAFDAENQKVQFQLAQQAMQFAQQDPNSSQTQLATRALLQHQVAAEAVKLGTDPKTLATTLGATVAKIQSDGVTPIEIAELMQKHPEFATLANATAQQYGSDVTSAGNWLMKQFSGDEGSMMAMLLGIPLALAGVMTGMSEGGGVMGLIMSIVGAGLAAYGAYGAGMFDGMLDGAPAGPAQAGAPPPGGGAAAGAAAAGAPTQAAPTNAAAGAAAGAPASLPPNIQAMIKAKNIQPEQANKWINDAVAAIDRTFPDSATVQRVKGEVVAAGLDWAQVANELVSVKVPANKQAIAKQRLGI